MFMTVIIIWLLVLGIATTHLILFLLSQLLLIVFVFGNTCKTIFEAIIFLFVMHPFDVGDRCVIDGNQA
jgi:small-conductance mechanosensitive channel